MKKIIFLIGLILFLLGCTGGGSGPSSAKIVENLHKGTQGLVIEFGKNTPPVKVAENDFFPAVVYLKNKGAFDINNGYLLLNLDENLDLNSGIEPYWYPDGNGDFAAGTSDATLQEPYLP